MNNLFCSVSVQVCISACAFGAVRQIRICPIPKFRTEIGLSLSIFSDYIQTSWILVGIPLAAAMRAQFFLYVFAHIYERICVKHTLQYVNGHAETVWLLLFKLSKQMQMDKLTP